MAEFKLRLQADFLSHFTRHAPQAGVRRMNFYAKMDTKSDPKSTFGRSGVRLLRFWGMFLGKRFFIIFTARKNHPKIKKMQPKIEKRPPRHFLIKFLILSEYAPTTRMPLYIIVLWLEHIQNLHFFHQISIKFSYIF